MRTTHSILDETIMRSVLASQSLVNPQDGKWKRNMVADLLLTALIDAFSILVIFLLMSFSSTGDILFLSKDTELPKAQLASELERNPVVRIEADKMFVEDRLATVDQLTGELLELRKKFMETHANMEYPGIVTIQGDRRLKYEVLSQVVAAASQAGYSDIRFAVTRK